ncbi:MAG: CoA ester lyase [Nocardioidaceae bacterium]|nr:MAG: CoA ester lyase [Nocardioidaceae bacterium]
MLPYRSWLFVPAHKGTWVDKAVKAGAQALILDLEDAVPEADKPLAREVAAESIDHLAADAPEVGVIVRVNALDTPHFGADLEAVVRPGLQALLLPKIYTDHDIIAFDALVRHFELRAGLELGTVGLIPSFETARGLVNAEEIARHPRVVSLMAAAAKDADISREVGFTWTPEGLETLYLRSRVILAGRAAGIGHIVVGLWQDIHDLSGLRGFAEANKQLGFTGQVLIHPSHVETVNEVYAVSEKELDRYQAMVDAYESGAANGQGAVLFEGEHIDLAHAQNARKILEFNRKPTPDRKEPTR